MFCLDTNYVETPVNLHIQVLDMPFWHLISAFSWLTGWTQENLLDPQHGPSLAVMPKFTCLCPSQLESIQWHKLSCSSYAFDRCVAVAQFNLLYGVAFAHRELQSHKAGSGA